MNKYEGSCYYLQNYGYSLDFLLNSLDEGQWIASCVFSVILCAITFGFTVPHITKVDRNQSYLDKTIHSAF